MPENSEASVEPNLEQHESNVVSLLEAIESDGFSAFLCRWKEEGEEESEVILSNTNDIEQDDAEMMILGLAMSIMSKLRDRPGYEQVLQQYLDILRED
jgi:hypothetical protein